MVSEWLCLSVILREFNFNLFSSSRLYDPLPDKDGASPLRALRKVSADPADRRAEER